MLLFMASRAQLVAERINPAIQAGKLVLADRFISSTLAYQGTAGGIDVADILRVGQIALRQTWPDLVVVFDVDIETARKRMSPLLRENEFDATHDRMEIKGAAFHQKVRQGYLDQAQNDPDRYLVIDARDDENVVFDRLIEGLRQKLG
jgi:dTMP kinase